MAGEFHRHSLGRGADVYYSVQYDKNHGVMGMTIRYGSPPGNDGTFTYKSGRGQMINVQTGVVAEGPNGKPDSLQALRDVQELFSDPKVHLRLAADMTAAGATLGEVQRMQERIRFERVEGAEAPKGGVNPGGPIDHPERTNSPQWKSLPRP